MLRTSFWPMLVVLLLGILLLREPRVQMLDERFLRWMLSNSQSQGAAVPLTVVDIGRDPASPRKEKSEEDATEAFLHGAGTFVSPLEYALFLQSVLEFQPTVIAFENVLRWRERDKDQEQVFIDQAMRVPKLLLGAELTDIPDPDATAVEVPAFAQVTGSRRDLREFSGVGWQPNEDMRLISTLGFVNLPAEISGDLRVPLLFRYRGEVIPAFALQAIMLWRRLTPGEIKIELGSHILLPDGHKIPIQSDGTLLINANAAQNTRRITLNELLLASQQHDSGGLTTAHLENLHDHLVLVRAPQNPHSPPDVFAATIATIQSNRYLQRVSQMFDLAVIVLATAFAGMLSRISRTALLLGAIAFTAAYGLVALAFLSRFLLWLPVCLPLGAVWFLVLISLFTPRNIRARTA